MDELNAAHEASEAPEGEPGEQAAPIDRAKLAKEWEAELEAAQKRLQPWHDEAEKALKAFRQSKGDDPEGRKQSGLALFYSNIITQLALLFGRTPSTAVRQRWADSQDEAARAASQILERLLDADIEDRIDGYCEALAAALQDFRIVGFGMARAHYEATFAKVRTAAVAAQPVPEGQQVAAEMEVEVKTDENVRLRYVHWRRVRWGSCSIWDECPWLAFETPMSQRDIEKRFGQGWADKLEFYASNSTEVLDKAERSKPGARARVWEIWDKDTRRVIWWSRGADEVLDVKDDPYELPGFFPGPRPLISNTTTEEFLPRPDFSYCARQYDRINATAEAQDRCVDNIGVKGAFNGLQAELGSIFKTRGNQLVPVQNWTAFQEGGGIRGAIDIVDILPFVNAIQALQARQGALQQEVYETTGASDLLRGAGSKGGRATAAESQLKAQFGGARMQLVEEQFAAFASALATLKAHLIGTMFDPERIVSRSNARATFDAQSPGLVEKAVMAIKDHALGYRVVIKPESLAVVDDQLMQAERQGVMTVVSQYLPAATQMAGQMPQAVPLLLSLLEWMMQGTKGASSVLAPIHLALEQARRAAATAQAQPAAPPPPDPKLLAVQAKTAGELAKVEAELRADLIRDQSEAQVAQAKEVAQREQNVMEAAQTRQMRPPKPMATREEQ